MNLFKSYTFTWWQMGILKLALLAAGATIGAYWHDFFGSNLITLIVVWVVAGIYTLYISFR